MRDCISFLKISLTVFAISVFASNPVLSAPDNANSDQKPWDNPNLGAEDVSLRDRYSKHFFVSPTQRKAMTFSGPIHFKSGNTWLEISNELEVNTSGRYPNHPYINEKNDFTSFYPSNPATDGFVMEYNGSVLVEKVLGLQYIDANGKVLGVSKFNFVASRLESGNVIRYSEVLPGMDLVYSQNNSGKKMFVEVKNASALSVIPSNTNKVSILEDITLPPNATTVLKDGNLEVSVNGNHVATYLRPMADEGKATSSLDQETEGAIGYSVNGNKLEFGSEFDAAWVTSSTRNFPFFLDPTANYGVYGVTYATGRMTSTSGSKQNGFLRLASSTTTAWAKFNISGLGVAGATSINSVKYYGYHYTGTISPNKVARIRDMNNTDPVSASNTAIRSQATTGTQYSSSLIWGVGSSYGWRNATLGSTANADIYGRITRGWTALGMTYVSGSTGFSYHYGYNGVTGRVCYLEIDYVVITSPNDAGIQSIATTSTCPGTAHNVNVRLKNFGTSPLTSCTVNWERNTGSGFVAQAPLAFGGTLAPGADTVLTVGTFTYASVNTTLALKAYPSLPNGVADTINTNDTASSNSTGAMAGTFTIGGSSPDFATLRAATDTLKKYGVCGNVVLRVRPGTYTQQMVFNGQINGVGPTATIKLMPDSGAGTVTYQFGGDALVFNGGAYVEVSNINIKTTVNYASAVYFQSSGNNITIDSCKLEGAVNPPSTTSSAYAAIYESSGSTKTEFLTISNCEILNGSYGVYYFGGGTSDLHEGVSFLNNSIKNWTYMGAYVYYTKNLKVIGNDISGIPGSYSYHYGAFLVYADNSEVSNNRIVTRGSSNGYSLYMSSSDGSVSDPIQVQNNMLSNPEARTNTTNYGMYINGSYIKCFYNSVYNNCSAFGTSSSATYFYATTGSEFKNNSVQNGGTGYAFNISTSSALQHDYNNFFTSGTTRGNFTPSINSKSGDPAYANPATADLHANSLALDSNATPISGLTIDYDGQTRNTTKPDIGADEFDLVSLDAAVTEVANGGLCPPNAPITVRVKNNGLVNLTSVTINWMASTNAGAYVAQTPLSVSGISIPVGSDSLFTVGTFSVTSGNSYKFKAYASGPNGGTDGNNSNDTLESSTLMPSLAAGTYTVGGSSPDFATIGAAVTALGNGICGAVTFNIRQGTYSGQVTIPAVEGSASNAWITFQADPANTTAVIVTHNSDFTWKFDKTTYVKVDGLTIRTTGAANVIEMVGSNHHITLSNNVITGYNTTSTSTSYAVIYDWSGSANQTNNFRIEGNTLNNGSYGMYLYGAGSGTNQQDSIIVVKNQILNYAYNGIHYYYNKNGLIDSNVITSRTNAYGFGCTGIYSYYSYNTQITYNTVWVKTTGYGKACYIYYNDGVYQSGRRTFIANNMFTALTNSTSTSSTGRSYIYYCDRSDVLNNSWYGTYNATSSSYGMLYLYGNNSNNFMNNSVYNAGNGYALRASYSGGTKNYNNLYSKNANRENSGTAMGANSTKLDPYYVDGANGDLHSYGPSLDSAANVSALVTMDIDGDSRNSSKPDIGADEFDADYDDAGVSMVMTTYCESKDTLTIVVKNFGWRNLMSATVNYGVSVNSGAYTMQTPVNWTGNLARNASDTIMLPMTSFTATNTYSVRAYTTMPNGATDSRMDNDTTTQTLTINADPVISSVTKVNITACPVEDGKLTINATGTATLMYKIEPDSALSTNNAYTGLRAGVYYPYVIDGNGCSTEAPADTLKLPGAPPAPVVLNTDTYCFKDMMLPLIGQKATGGTIRWYSDQQLVNFISTGDSLKADTTVGVHNYYASQTVAGCESPGTLGFVRVHALPVVNATSVPDRCVDAASDTLKFGTPVGGSYTGSGVSSGIFSASTAGFGAHTLTYSYTDANTCTNTNTTVAQVDSLPVAAMTALANVCANSPSMTLSNGSATPTGGTGTYFGAAVSSGSFDPSVAMAGRDTIYYAYEDLNGCKDTAMTMIDVDTVPIIAVAQLGPWCADDTNITLVGGTPLGGTFSGADVTAGVFNPSKVAPGLQTVSYSYTDGNSCADSTLATLTVNPLPLVNLTLQKKICLNSVGLTLSGGRPTGVGSGVYSGNNVTAGVYKPSTIAVDTVTYNYTDPNGCFNKTSKVIKVDTVPSVAMSNISDMCEGGNAVMLNQGSPSGGVYSGVNVSGSMFNPASNGMYTVTYTYTDANSCRDSVSKTFSVDTVPMVSFSPSITYCSNTPMIGLTSGAPAGGRYDGPGVSGTDFDPSVAGAGTHTLQYYFDDGKCADSIAQVVTVRAAPVVTMQDLGYMCLNDGSMQLSGGRPAGGVYSGNGVTGSMFSADTSRLGANTISYNVAAANGCEDSTSQTLTVESNPTFNLGPDITSCGKGAKTLTVSVSNVIYQWSDGTSGNSTVANQTGKWTCYVIDTATMARCTFSDTVNVTHDAECLGVDAKLADRVNVRYYPNPSSGRFTAEISGLEGEKVDMVIVNMQGQTVYTTNWEEMPVMFRDEIDLSGEASGMYFINLSTSEGQVLHRISIGK